MSLKDKILSVVSKKSDILDTMLEEDYENIQNVIMYKTLAIETCVTLIANALSMCIFDTYKDGKKVRLNDYYRFNIQSNINQNATDFWKEVTYKILTKNECLVVVVNDEFYIADSYDRTENALVQNTYKNVVVKGYQLRDVFTENQVLFFKYNNKDIKKVVDSVYTDYSDLVALAKKLYKRSGGQKGIVTLETLATINQKEKEAREDLFNTQFKRWFNSDYAVLPLGRGMTYKEQENKVNINNTRDIKNIVDDVYSFVCSAYHVPTMLAMGSVAGLNDLIDSFLMFAVKPVVELIQSETNRKSYTQEQIAKMTFVKVDMKKIKLVDIQKLAVTSDKFLAGGVHSINDNREMLDEVPIQEEWANKHFMTKNYQDILFEEGDGANEK